MLSVVYAPSISTTPTPPVAMFSKFQDILRWSLHGAKASLSTFFAHSSVIAPLFLLPAIEDLHFNQSLRDEIIREFDLENNEEYA